MFELSLAGAPDEQSEDCLSLNVWTPEIDAARRPVMVWVHGGAFVTGSSAVPLYRGGLLAREGDVVVVTINYRLGILGFLAHPALEESDQAWLDGQPWSGFGNWGLADQVAALRWVRDHISQFGGDPGNVTLFGESAGGMGISSLLAVPAARGLFHKAIVESGPPYWSSTDHAAERAQRLVAGIGSDLTRAALEQVPAEELVRAVTEFGTARGEGDDSGLMMMPVVDGGLLPDAPAAEIAAGSASSVPLLIGTTRDETAFFTAGAPALNSLDDDGLRRWMRRLSPDAEAVDTLIAIVGEVRARRGEPVGPRDLWVAISTEYVFRLPSIRMADAHARAADPGVGTYCYLFTWESPAFGGYLGSCHALEIPFVFGTVHNPAVQGFSGRGEEAMALSATIRAEWVAFARNGAPGEWPTWDPDRRPTLVLGPWPGSEGVRHRVGRPRDEELEAVASLVPVEVAVQGLHPPL